MSRAPVRPLIMLEMCGSETPNRNANSLYFRRSSLRSCLIWMRSCSPIFDNPATTAIKQ